MTSSETPALQVRRVDEMQTLFWKHYAWDMRHHRRESEIESVMLIEVLAMENQNYIDVAFRSRVSTDSEPCGSIIQK